jgi:adenine-specific DNA-methyltransferase
MNEKDYANWSKEELIKEITKFKKIKKYGLVWEDKPEQVAELCKEKLPVLTEDKSKEIKTEGSSKSQIFREG